MALLAVSMEKKKKKKGMGKLPKGSSYKPGKYSSDSIEHSQE